MAVEHESEHRAFRDRTAREHEERLHGYRALLAQIESAAGEATIEADRTGSTNTASQFTDDIRYLIGVTEALLNRFRHRDDSAPSDAGPKAPVQP
jgi:hypothetical protein